MDINPLFVSSVVKDSIRRETTRITGKQQNTVGPDKDRNSVTTFEVLLAKPLNKRLYTVFGPTVN